MDLPDFRGDVPQLQSWMRNRAIELSAARQRSTVLELELCGVARALIREMRIADGAGLRPLAKRLGCSAQYLCDIANGRRKVSDQMLKKFTRR